jgi:hypothetical protein
VPKTCVTKNDPASVFTRRCTTSRPRQGSRDHPSLFHEEISGTGRPFDAHRGEASCHGFEVLVSHFHFHLNEQLTDTGAMDYGASQTAISC